MALENGDSSVKRLYVGASQSDQDEAWMVSVV